MCFLEKRIFGGNSMEIVVVTENEIFLWLIEYILTSYGVKVIHLHQKYDFTGMSPSSIIVDSCMKGYEEFLNKALLFNTHPIIVIDSGNKTSVQNLIKSFNLHNSSEGTSVLNSDNKANSTFFLRKDLTFDVANHCLYKNGETILVSAVEFKLLYALVTANNPISADRLIDYLGTTGPAVLYVYIKKIRDKIEINPNQPRILVNIRGRGYCIKPHVMNQIGS